MGVTYRGKHSDEFGLAVRTNPSLLPEFDLLMQEVPNSNGFYFNGVKYKSRPIPLEVAFIAQDLQDYSTRFRALADWLRPDLGVGELVDDNEPDKRYYAVLESQDIKRMDNIARMGQGSLVLVCPDSFAFGKEHKTIALKKYTWEQYASQTWEGIINGNDNS